MITIKCKSRLDEELLAAELRRRGAVINALLESDLETGEVPEELLEASSTLGISKIKNHKGGSELITHLHGTEKLGHDQAWEHHDLNAAPRGSSIWSIIREADTWLLVLGKRGTAAILHDKTRSGLKVIASGDKIETKHFKDGPSSYEWLKGKIGELEEHYYQGTDSGKVKKVQAHRQALAEPSPKWKPNRRVAERRGPNRRVAERRGPGEN